MQLRRLLFPMLLGAGLVLALPAGPAAARSGAPVSQVLRNDVDGLRLRLDFDTDAIRESADGVLLRLDGCNLESAGPADSVLTGAPLLPRWRGQVALPPGKRAVLSWQLLGSTPLAGAPLPFPTPRDDIGGPESLPSEQYLRDPVAYGRDYPVDVRLGALRQLRDQRVQELLVSPASWTPGGGLRLANTLVIELRFVPDAAAAAGAAEALRRPDRLFQPIYDSALLNADVAAGWARRVPPVNADRAGRAQASVKALTHDDGLYGITGAQLGGWGIASGTPLASLAVFTQRLSWSGGGEPIFTQSPRERYVIDRNADGLLNDDDVLVFLGRRLADETDSPDRLEWYGRDAAVFVGVDPALVSDMVTEPAWTDGGVWTTPADFERRRRAVGEDYFLAFPPTVLYDSVNERWASNLYYFNLPSASDGFTLNTPMASPGRVDGVPARLDLHFQGSLNSATARVFDIEIVNGGGTTALDQCVFAFAQPYDYGAVVPAGALADGDNTLRIRRDRIWGALLDNWMLSYRSRYEAVDDSLAFTCGDLSGDLELRVGGLSGPWQGWQLLRVGAPGATPTRLLLEAANASGTAGDYTLSLRQSTLGDERFLLVDENALRAPTLAAAADVAVLGEAGPCDVLAVSHPDFVAGMQRWVDFRESQGYRARLLDNDTVWDLFGGGVRSGVAIRNAARFAHQQWGAAALVLVGDSNKDAREVNALARPDFVPSFQRQEDVLGNYELVTLDEAAVKFSIGAWPSLMMGRLPVGNVTELNTLLDKIEGYETYGNAGGDDWRSRFLFAADDCWVYDGYYEPFECKTHEMEFEGGQEELRSYMAAENVPGDLHAEPWYLSVLTDPWFAEHPTAILSEVQSNLRPIVSAAFTDTLSKGWGFVTVQSHANRNLLGHEEYFKTLYGADDQELLTNGGKPFVWSVLGCHGNDFAVFNEGNLAADCMGEKLLFLSGGRGAVASYASAGYEYLFPNVDLERQLIHLMFSTSPTELQLSPDWRLGTLQLAAELRYGQYNSSLRYDLLGDPLTRVDPRPPRVRLFADGVELGREDYIPVLSPGDTLLLEALAVDESRMAPPRLDDQLGPLNADLRAAWVPFHADSALFDSLLTQTDTLLVDLTAPLDSLAADQGAGARGWYLAARVPYEGDRDYLAVSVTDQAGREGRFELPAAKVVRFFSDQGDSLREGQWVRSEGRLHMRIRVPSTTFAPGEFSFWEDGALRADVVASFAGDNPDTTLYLMDADYAWAPGEHQLELHHQGDVYDSIALQVDARARLLDGVIFPNPFRAVTTFQYTLSGGVRDGSLSIYTLSGRRIHREQVSALSEGEKHVLSWNGHDDVGDPVANGVYLMRLVFTDLAGNEVVWEDRVVRMR